MPSPITKVRKERSSFLPISKMCTTSSSGSGSSNSGSNTWWHRLAYHSTCPADYPSHAKQPSELLPQQGAYIPRHAVRDAHVAMPPVMRNKLPRRSKKSPSSHVPAVRSDRGTAMEKLRSLSGSRISWQWESVSGDGGASFDASIDEDEGVHVARKVSVRGGGGASSEGGIDEDEEAGVFPLESASRQDSAAEFASLSKLEDFGPVEAAQMKEHFGPMAEVSRWSSSSSSACSSPTCSDPISSAEGGYLTPAEDQCRLLELRLRLVALKLQELLQPPDRIEQATTGGGFVTTLSSPEQSYPKVLHSNQCSSRTAEFSSSQSDDLSVRSGKRVKL